MRKIIDFFKRLFTGKKKAEENKPSLGSKYKEPEFNLDLVIDTLKSYQKDPSLIEKDAKEWNVTLDDNWKSSVQYGRSVQNIKDQLALQDYIHKALYYYSKGEDKLQNFLSNMIPMLEDWKADYEAGVEKRKKERKEELEKEGLLCPDCFKRGYIEGMKRIQNGIFEIHYEEANPTSDGSHVGGCTNYEYSMQCDEYQYHGRICPNCGKRIVDEYRKTPSWLEDLFHIQPEFIKGSDWDAGIKYNKSPYSYWRDTVFKR